MGNIGDFLISIPGWLLNWCNKIVGNQYIFALLIFAFIVEIILLPFGIKQQKNAIKQAKMRPKEMAIRKKYAGRDDQATKQKMSMEIQEMYQKEGYNPMGGCLPLLIQFPIIIALYNIVMNPLKYICGMSTQAINEVIAKVQSFPEYANTTFTANRNIDLMSAMKKIIENHGNVFTAQGIESVDALPNLSMFGGAVDLAATPSFSNFNWLLLIPVLTFLAYFFSMKINKKLMYNPAQNDPAMGCSNKMMDYMMPLMSVFITFGVPAALGVYWIFKCIIGVIKQALLSVCMPMPKLSEEEIKAAEQEYNAKASKKPERNLPEGKKYRSLHHIDDEDEVVSTPAVTEPKKVEEKTEEKTEEKESVVERAELKEDNTEENLRAYRKKFNKKDDDKN